MGIQVEYNPDLALRAFGTSNREADECLPQELRIGDKHSFLKKGQRNYFLEGDIPLLETKGNQQLSEIKASIIIIEATHLLINNKPYTRGTYKITGLPPNIRFEGFKMIVEERKEDD